MPSISGLQSGYFTDVDIRYDLALNGTVGDTNQVVVSGGETGDTNWAHITSVVPLADLLTAGNGVAITTTGNPETISTNNDGTTINNTGGTGTQNQVLKVPNALTAGTNVSFSSGTTYDGSAAITINTTDTTYTAGDGIEIGGTVIESKIDEDTIDYDGSGTMEVIKVPNALSAGTNLSYSSGSTFDGDAARTINLDTALTGMTGITYTGSGTTLTGGGGAGDETAATYIDLTSATNLMPSLYPEQVKPYLVFDVYDPSSVDTDSLSTSYVQIFSGNLSNSFTAKTTAVEVQLQIFHAASTSNRWLYLRLSDGGGNEWSGGTGTGGGYGTGTRNTERLVSYPDENDKRQMVMSWYLQGLTIGNSYTINPYAKTSSTWNYIYAGGSYPPCILKVINL